MFNAVPAFILVYRVVYYKKRKVDVCIRRMD